MFDKSFFSQIKRTNASIDAEKTRKRAEQLWKSASPANKQMVDELAGVSRQSIYRIYKTGAISAKLVAVMAQVFNVNPRWLAGETDAQSPSSDALIADFLRENNYAKIPGSLNQFVSQPNDGFSEADDNGSDADLTPGDTPYDDSQSISEDEAVVLLKALFIRARIDEEAATSLGNVMAKLLQL